MADHNKPPANDMAQKALNLISKFLSKKIRTAIYSARESIGEHKRDIVVAHVEQASGSAALPGFRKGKTPCHT